MPRKPCYWTRKLELDLVDFVRQRDFIWKPIGNTNHHIQQKYKAYAEFAAKLGRGFTARSVRDRWVNIRSTFNHNLRRVDKSKEKAKSQADVYVPCWPLWKPLQFLKCIARREGSFDDYSLLQHQPDFTDLSNLQVKEEFTSDIDDLMVRQNDQRTDRPRRKMKIKTNKETAYDESGILMIRRGQRKDIPRKSKFTNNKCKRVIDDLVRAMKPLTDNPLVNLSTPEQSYWFFGKHVTERLNSMRDVNAECASREIMKILDAVESNADDIDINLR